MLSLSVGTLVKLRDNIENFGLAGLVKAVDDAEAARLVVLEEADKKVRIGVDGRVKARLPAMKHMVMYLRCLS